MERPSGSRLGPRSGIERSFSWGLTWSVRAGSGNREVESVRSGLDRHRPGQRLRENDEIVVPIEIAVGDRDSDRETPTRGRRGRPRSGWGLGQPVITIGRVVSRKYLAGSAHDGWLFGGRS